MLPDFIPTLLSKYHVLSYETPSFLFNCVLYFHLSMWPFLLFKYELCSLLLSKKIFLPYMPVISPFFLLKFQVSQKRSLFLISLSSPISLTCRLLNTAK